jgi:hypothetical protein
MCQMKTGDYTKNEKIKFENEKLWPQLLLNGERKAESLHEF